MSTWVVTHSRTLPPAPELERCAAGVLSSLSFVVNIEAVRNRIFQALTNAEYMETWLTIPGQRRGTAAVVTSNPEGFQIQYQDENAGAASIAGSYEACRRGKILFLWKCARGISAAPSKVAIRLYGNFSDTKLSLVHSGFCSEEDRSWHRTLWERSLDKMSRVLNRAAYLS